VFFMTKKNRVLSKKFDNLASKKYSSNKE